MGKGEHLKMSLEGSLRVYDRAVPLLAVRRLLRLDSLKVILTALMKTTVFSSEIEIEIV